MLARAGPRDMGSLCQGFAIVIQEAEEQDHNRIRLVMLMPVVAAAWAGLMFITVLLNQFHSKCVTARTVK